MGVVPGIGFDRFPAQGKFLGLRVKVCFNYETARTIGGKVIRDDAEEPGLMLIQLDDGRVVQSTECQYSMPTAETVQ